MKFFSRQPALVLCSICFNTPVFVSSFYFGFISIRKWKYCGFFCSLPNCQALNEIPACREVPLSSHSLLTSVQAVNIERLFASPEKALTSTLDILAEIGERERKKKTKQFLPSILNCQQRWGLIYCFLSVVCSKTANCFEPIVVFVKFLQGLELSHIICRLHKI